MENCVQAPRALMTKRILKNLSTKLFCLFALITALTFPARATSDEVVNVYSARHYDTDMALYEEFTRQTGIEVNLIEGGSDALIERIRNEGEFSPADMLITSSVCMRSSSNIYNLSLMSSIIEAHGARAAEDWARGVVANFARAPQGNDTAQLRAVASGECGITVANTYYVGRLIGSDDPKNNAITDALTIVFPNQGDRGAHVNISGAGVTRYAPNKEKAIRFHEYLTSDFAQRLFAEGNNEYPIVGPTSGPVASLGPFEEDTINSAVLGQRQAEAVRVFDRAGWQ